MAHWIMRYPQKQIFTSKGGIPVVAADRNLDTLGSFDLRERRGYITNVQQPNNKQAQSRGEKHST